MSAPSRPSMPLRAGRSAAHGLLVAWVYAILLISWVVMEVFERRRHRRARRAAGALHRGAGLAPVTPRIAKQPLRREDLPAFASFHTDAPLAAVLDRELTQADVDELVRRFE